MHKQIPVSKVATVSDGDAIARALETALEGKLSFPVARIHVIAERDSNANRWLVIRLMLKEPNRDL